MPGFELWGDEERREVEEVLETGILMRYGFDGPRRGRWKARDLEAALCRVLQPADERPLPERSTALGQPS